MSRNDSPVNRAETLSTCLELAVRENKQALFIELMKAGACFDKVLEMPARKEINLNQTLALIKELPKGKRLTPYPYTSPASLVAMADSLKNNAPLQPNANTPHDSQAPMAKAAQAASNNPKINSQLFRESGDNQTSYTEPSARKKRRTESGTTTSDSSTSHSEPPYLTYS